MIGVLANILTPARAPDLRIFVLGGILASAVSAALISLLRRLTGTNPGYEQTDHANPSPSSEAIEHYSAAWRDRRVRFFVFKATQLSFFLVLFLLFLISRNHPRVPFGAAIFPFAAWFAVYIAAGIWLNRFRCPRCGKLYYWRTEWKGSVERQKRWRDCHYCGLHQDEIPEKSDTVVTVGSA